MSRPTRLEGGTNHVLAWCTSCTPWRRLTGTRPEALRAAADHLQLVHGESGLAKQLRAQAAKIDGRHAE